MFKIYTKKIRYGEDVNKSMYHSDISIVSSIIHDGIKNRDELIRKYAAITNRPYRVAEKCIKMLEARDEMGYYIEAVTKDDPIPTYYFVIWDGTKPAFPPSRVYLKGESYFKAFFRER